MALKNRNNTFEPNPWWGRLKRKGAKTQGKRNLYLRFLNCALATLRLTFCGNAYTQGRGDARETQ